MARGKAKTVTEAMGVKEVRKGFEELFQEVRETLGLVEYVIEEAADLQAKMLELRKHYIRVKSENIKLTKDFQKAAAMRPGRKGKADKSEREAQGNGEAGRKRKLTRVSPEERERLIAEIRKFRTDHPDATWAEIYAAVPSHFRNKESMQASLKGATETKREAAAE